MSACCGPVVVGEPSVLGLHVSGHPAEGTHLAAEWTYHGGHEGTSRVEWIRTKSVRVAPAPPPLPLPEGEDSMTDGTEWRAVAPDAVEGAVVVATSTKVCLETRLRGSSCKR